MNGGHSCFPFSFSCTQKLWLLHAIKSAWLNEISLQQWSQNLPSWGACSFISPGNFQIYWDTCSLVNPAAILEGVNCFWAWVVLTYPTTDRDRTELSKKVCPRLRDRATAPAGGITQHRTTCLDHSVDSLYLYRPRPHSHFKHLIGKSLGRTASLEFETLSLIHILEFLAWPQNYE